MAVERRIDLTRQGDLSIDATQKPHDVVITPAGDSIFVSVLGDLDESDDAILKIDAAAGAVVARRDLPAGADPHLALSPAAPRLLYSPQQNLGVVALYDQDDLAEVQDSLAIPHAHGISTSVDGTYLYVTNIAGGGVGALETVRAASSTEKRPLASPASLLGPPADAPGEGKPHNVGVTREGHVFVTHSGAAANLVSVYSTDEVTGLPSLAGQHEVGTNPFGIAVVRYECDTTSVTTSKARRTVNTHALQGIFLFGVAVWRICV